MRNPIHLDTWSRHHPTRAPVPTLAASLALVLAAMGARPQPARADAARPAAPPAAAVTKVEAGLVVGAAGRSPADASLVGPSGELYVPDGAGGFVRRAEGGVATELVVAGGPTADDVWAMGRVAPSYHHDGSAWSAVPAGQGARGAARFAPGGPALAVKGEILVRGDHGWQALPAPDRSRGGGRRTVTAVAATGPRDVYMAQGATVLHYDGRRWRPIEARAGLHPGETITDLLALGGAGGADVVAVGSEGSTLVVAKDRARQLVLGTGMVSLWPRAATLPADAAARAAGGPALIVGEATLRGRARPTSVVATIRNGRAELLAEVPDLPDGDPAVALVGSADGQLLVVTRGGELRTRSATGDWASARVRRAPPAEAAHPANPPARAR